MEATDVPSKRPCTSGSSSVAASCDMGGTNPVAISPELQAILESCRMEMSATMDQMGSQLLGKFSTMCLGLEARLDLQNSHFQDQLEVLADQQTKAAREQKDMLANQHVRGILGAGTGGPFAARRSEHWCC
jgi:hypothetical protein